jgi:hypothetical protein
MFKYILINTKFKLAIIPNIVGFSRLFYYVLHNVR